MKGEHGVTLDRSKRFDVAPEGKQIFELMLNTDAVLDFRVLPHPHLCAVVRQGVADFARAHGVADEDLTHILTALGEALANAIEHGGAAEPIDVQVRVGGDRIVVTVADSGIGFPSELISPPDLPEPHAERGRGLPIMRRCTDIFTIRSVPGRGTSVVLGRYLRQAAANTSRGVA
jgi:anti-sigma regulatory factor (Ser/Thr protein kinase)